MPGRKFVLPSWATETPDSAGALAHMGKIDTAIAVLAEALGGFAPGCAAAPDLTVKVGAGRLSNALGLAINSAGGATLSSGGPPSEMLVVQVAEQSITLSAPAAAPKICRIALNPINGAVAAFSGAEAAAPAAPALPAGWLPIAQVLVLPGQTQITGAHITDERGLAFLTQKVAGGHDGETIISEAYCRVAVFCPESRRIPGHGGVDLSTSFTPPAGTAMMRVTAVGPGGGAGGGWAAGTGMSPQLASGGGGGGGGMVSRLWLPETLTLTVPCGGAGGSGSVGGANNSVAGTAAAATVVTGATSGFTMSANGGGGGARGTSTPAAGAAGAAGTAPADGFSGGAGEAGYLGTNNTLAARKGGSVGEQGQFRPQGNWNGAQAGQFSPGLIAEQVWGVGGIASVATNIDGTNNSGGSGGPGGEGVVIIEWW